MGLRTIEMILAIRSMTTIKRLSRRQAIINFPDFDVRIFTKYKGVYCLEIRIWKLPPKSTFLRMFNTKNLIWAVYGKGATVLHGWFNKESDLLKAIANKVVQCKNFEELKELLIDFEEIMSGRIPTSDKFMA